MVPSIRPVEILISAEDFSVVPAGREQDVPNDRQYFHGAVVYAHEIVRQRQTQHNMTMMLSILSVLLVGSTATFSLLLGTATADCLVEGDMVFVEGQSTGYLGLECLNSTH